MTPQRAYTPKYRIVNFSLLALSDPRAISVAHLDIDEMVATLRTHVDLPCIYLVSAQGRELIGAVLERLEAIRSACYPYALFVVDGDYAALENDDLPVLSVAGREPEEVSTLIQQWAAARFCFDKQRLAIKNQAPLPGQVDVVIVGGGITGLYAANRLAEQNISFCIVEQQDIVGGIWSHYANATSQVNTSEGAYRVVERKRRNNRDHSSTAEILEDLNLLAHRVSESIFTRTRALKVSKGGQGYLTKVIRDSLESTISSTGLIVAVNDRVGAPRTPTWENQQRFQGAIISGSSDESLGLDWTGKQVVIVGMGAFAVENARTALENGAAQVHVVCRRHGTVCPKIIDYLNFSTSYDDNFEHDKRSNIRNMMLWKKLYEMSGASQPECWMGMIKHRGHTISVSDIWFIAHHLKKLRTVTGSITEMYDSGVIVNHDLKIEADIVVNCVGFSRNSPLVRELCGYSQTYNNNYLDKDFMYLADAYIDDDVFNSFFGSSVLEMTKFYLDVYIHFFNNPEFDNMIRSPGIERLPIEERSWSHYIAGAESLMNYSPFFYDQARKQIDIRSANFYESHDLATYIAQNKREWFATHAQLAGTALPESECLPYPFDKLLETK